MFLLAVHVYYFKYIEGKKTRLFTFYLKKKKLGVVPYRWLEATQSPQLFPFLFGCSSPFVLIGYILVLDGRFVWCLGPVWKPLAIAMEIMNMMARLMGFFKQNPRYRTLTLFYTFFLCNHIRVIRTISVSLSIVIWVSIKFFPTILTPWYWSIYECRGKACSLDTAIYEKIDRKRLTLRWIAMSIFFVFCFN